MKLLEKRGSIVLFWSSAVGKLWYDKVWPDFTAVAGTCTATISGATGNIQSFSTAIQQITMVTIRGIVKAQPSSLSTDGTSFTVTWQHS